MFVKTFALLFITTIPVVSQMITISPEETSTMSQNITRKSGPLCACTHLDDCNCQLDLSIEFIVLDLHCELILVLLVLIADTFLSEMCVRVCVTVL